MSAPTPVVPTTTGPLYRHLVATTLVTCLVTVAALAADAMAPWAAGLVVVTSLALAAHAAHLRRSPGRCGCPSDAEEVRR